MSTGLASECSNDPNECTPKNLCTVATSQKDGNTIWSDASAASKHVSFAKELNINCGVVEIVDPCDADANQCKISQLCEKATLEVDGVKSWNDEADAYVSLAKDYGLSCAVNEKLHCNTHLGKCTPDQLCARSTYTDPTINKKVWQNSSKKFVQEAKKRGLTCGVTETPKCSLPIQKACEDKVILCRTAVKNGKWDPRPAFARYVLEAKRQGLSCAAQKKNTAPKLDLRQAFITQSTTERQKLQYALKELGLYKFAIDGLWGKGTQKALEQFVSNNGYSGASDSSIFRALLQRVKVPNFINCSKNVSDTSNCSNESICRHGKIWGDWSAFSGDQKFVREGIKRGLSCKSKNSNSASDSRQKTQKSMTSSSDNSSTKFYKGMKPIISNPKTSAKQAWAICDPQARLAANNSEARNQGSGSRNLRCKTDPDFLGGSRTKCTESSSGDGWPGLIPLLLEIDPASKARRAGEKVYSATMDSCLAQYGWER